MINDKDQILEFLNMVHIQPDLGIREMVCIHLDSQGMIDLEIGETLEDMIDHGHQSSLLYLLHSRGALVASVKTVTRSRN